jgi:hypothetical protein
VVVKGDATLPSQNDGLTTRNTKQQTSASTSTGLKTIHPAVIVFHKFISIPTDTVM